MIQRSSWDYYQFEDYKVPIWNHHVIAKPLKDYIPGSAVLNIDVEVTQHWDTMDPKVVALCGDDEPEFSTCDTVCS